MNTTKLAMIHTATRMFLEKGWYRDAIVAMMTTSIDDDTVVTLIPRGLSSYRYLHNQEGRWVKITRKNESLFQ